jgi:hypothetical protein
VAPVATPTPTPAVLDKQAAKLREHAAGLNRRQAARDEQDGTDFGTRLDDAKRSAASARQAAEAATTEAGEHHDGAKDMLARAKSFEDDAARLDAGGDVHARSLADDYREQAQAYRTAAIASTRRAERAEQAARQQLDDAERYDRDAFQTERAWDDRMRSNATMRHTANQLEEKADAYEQAADKLRTASGSPDPAQSEVLTRQASEYIAQADRITPDFSRIGTDDIVAAGIPLSEVPGADLMHPGSLVDPEPVDLHDTDLMKPGDLDPVDPRPVDLHDTDLMKPGDLDPVDPGAPGVPGADPSPAAGPVDVPPDDDLLNLGLDPLVVPGSSTGDDGLLMGPAQSSLSTDTIPGQDTYMDPPDEPDLAATTDYSTTYGDPTGEYA